MKCLPEYEQSSTLLFLCVSKTNGHKPHHGTVLLLSCCVPQMGHSSYGRGAPHVCYMQAGNQCMFYSRVDQQQQQQTSPSWGQVAQHAMHAAVSFLGGSSRGSLLAAAAGAGANAAAVPPEDYSAAQQPAGGSTGSGFQGPGVGGAQWRVLVVQGLVLAAALLVGGVVLKHFFRSVVAALVACYSGLFFKA
jgi:hypothetical protein